LTNFIKKSTGEHHVGFIGPVSAGKTSYINALFGLKLPTALSHCTEDCSVVHKDNKNIIWDVFGSNDTFRFFDPESLAFVKDLDVCVLLFCDDITMVSNMLKIVYAINKNLIIVRTKCDLYSEDDARTIEEEKVLDGKKANVILGTQDIKTYCISSRNVAKKTGKDFDWEIVKSLMGFV
jgi:GTPase SAR1 family protein